MRLSFDVDVCCDEWELVGLPEHPSPAVTRRRLRCTGCGRRKVLTVTLVADRTAEPPRADVIPLRSIR